MPWSTPLHAEEQFSHLVPAGVIAYRAFVAQPGTNIPVPARRYFGDDPDGTLLIGESVAGRDRFLDLVYAMRGQIYNLGHSAGHRYYDWFGYGDSVAEHVRFQWIDLQPSVQTFLAAGRQVTPNDISTAAELLLMYAYRNDFGDLPPCNQRDPNYRQVTNWLQGMGITPTYRANDGRLNVPLLDLPGLPAITWAEALACV